VISYEEYHLYGTAAFRQMNADIEAPAKRYRYTGMERDEESGLSYHGARYLSLHMGRWISTDPVGIEGGLNLYTYAEDNPVALVDVDGLAPLSQTQNLQEWMSRIRLKQPTP